MGVSDPLPAGYVIWFGSLEFRATGNGYLMELLSPRRNPDVLLGDFFCLRVVDKLSLFEGVHVCPYIGWGAGLHETLDPCGA